MIRYLPILLGGLCLLVFLPLFMNLKRVHHVPAVFCKAGASLCAFGIGIAAALIGGETAWLCAGALLLCAAADVLLEINFLAGMAVFLGGHILYLLFFLHAVPFGLAHGMALIVLLFGCGTVLYRLRKPIRERKMLPAFISYGVVLCVMGACGIACYTLGPAGILLAAGAMLFVGSDMLVCVNTVLPTEKIWDWTAMLTYELALLLIASGSLMLVW